jgi:hypothetical protein
MAVTTGTRVVFKRTDPSSGCWKTTQILERSFSGGCKLMQRLSADHGLPALQARRDEMSRRRTAEKTHLQPCDGQRDGEEHGPQAAALCGNHQDGQRDAGPDRWKDCEYLKHCAEKCAENHEHYHNKALISTPHCYISGQVIIKLLSSD